MQIAPSYFVEEVRVVRDSIAPSYVVEEVRAMRDGGELHPTGCN